MTADPSNPYRLSAHDWRTLDKMRQVAARTKGNRP
jgi:hypothetical protein